MPSAVFGKDHVVVTLPNMDDMGSAQRGRSCNIIRMLISNGGMTERAVSERLVLSVPRTRETIRKMEKDGIVTVMMPHGNRIVFLNDRKAWTERMESRNVGSGDVMCPPSDRADGGVCPVL